MAIMTKYEAEVYDLFRTVTLPAGYKLTGTNVEFLFCLTHKGDVVSYVKVEPYQDTQTFSQRVCVKGYHKPSHPRLTNERGTVYDTVKDWLAVSVARHKMVGGGEGSGSQRP